MNKTYLYVGVMLAVLIAAVVTLISLSGSSMATGSAAPSPSASKVSSPSKAVSSASPTYAPADALPSVASTPEKIVVIYSCKEGISTYKKYTSYAELWALPGGGGNCSSTMSPGDPSELEIKALTTAYGDDYDVDSLGHLYGSCGMTTFDTGTTGSMAQELLASTVLCPEHPLAAEMKATALAGIELQARTMADRQEMDKAIAEGRQVGPGHYLIGVDVQPGTWQTVGDKVADCYWEVSDAQGNILANNFVSTAPPFAIEVPAGPGGFTIQGCSFRQVSP